MRLAITGADGLFGRALVRAAGAAHTAIPLTRATADLTDPHAVVKVLTRQRPDALIHAAAIPDPDRCEREPELAFRVNVLATRSIVKVAQDLSFPVALISTDAVFDGTSASPYDETSPAHPISVYGRTKLEAEHAVAELKQHWIFRVSVLFGPGKENFVDKGLRLLGQGKSYIVASDQVGTATYTPEAAHKILETMASGSSGLFHLCNQGVCSRLELARHAAYLAGLPQEMIIGNTLAEMGRIAARPKYAVMKMTALKNAGIDPPRRWQTALEEHISVLAAQA